MSAEIVEREVVVEPDVVVEQPFWKLLCKLLFEISPVEIRRSLKFYCNETYQLIKKHNKVHPNEASYKYSYTMDFWQIFLKECNEFKIDFLDGSEFSMLAIELLSKCNYTKVFSYLLGQAKGPDLEYYVSIMKHFDIDYNEFYVKIINKEQGKYIRISFSMYMKM